LEFGFGVSYSDYHMYSETPISQGIVKLGTDYRVNKWLVLNTGLIYQTYANSNLTSHNITMPAMVVFNYRHRFRFLVGTSFEYHLTSVSKIKYSNETKKSYKRDPHYTGAIGAFLSFGAKWVIYQSDKIDINLSFIYNTMFNAKKYNYIAEAYQTSTTYSSNSSYTTYSTLYVNASAPIMQTNYNFCIGVSYKLFKNGE
jgi:hypothetical protein